MTYHLNADDTTQIVLRVQKATRKVYIMPHYITVYYSDGDSSPGELVLYPVEGTQSPVLPLVQLSPSVSNERKEHNLFII